MFLGRVASDSASTKDEVMDRAKVDQLQKEFPQLFQDLWGDKRVTCMSWGLEVQDGWYDLIHKLCVDLMALEPGPDFKAEQVKEKFGGLRFYVSGYPEDEAKWKKINEVISAVEKESFGICEMCGTTEGIEVKGGWVKAFCAPCREKWNKRGD